MNEPTVKIICSKCGGENVVIPCNDPSIKYKCLDCGHIKTYDPWEKIVASKYWNNSKTGKIKF